MEIRLCTSTGFVHHYSAEELYVLTRHWMTDIQFFEKEIHFLQSILQQFSVFNDDDDFSSQLGQISERLQDLTEKKNLLKNSIETYQTQLFTILDKTHDHKAAVFSEAHSKMEGEFFDFIKMYRQLKLDLFASNKKLRETA